MPHSPAHLGGIRTCEHVNGRRNLLNGFGSHTLARRNVAHDQTETHSASRAHDNAACGLTNHWYPVQKHAEFHYLVELQLAGSLENSRIGRECTAEEVQLATPSRMKNKQRHAQHWPPIMPSCTSSREVVEKTRAILLLCYLLGLHRGLSSLFWAVFVSLAFPAMFFLLWMSVTSSQSSPPGSSPPAPLSRSISCVTSASAS